MIGVDYAEMTSLGTSNAKTQLNSGNNLILPAWARTILAVIPIAMSDTPTANKPVIPQLVLESDDFNVQPFEVLGAPLTGPIASNPGQVGKSERWILNCPVHGGDQLKIYGKNLQADGTAAPYMGCAIIVSDQPPQGAQSHARMGTLTATGAAATDVAGTAYNFSGGRAIKEIFGTLVFNAQAADEGYLGYTRYASSEFTHPTPLKLPLEALCGADTAAAGSMCPGVSRVKVDVPVQPGPVTINDYNRIILAGAATGLWISGVVYE